MAFDLALDLQNKISGELVLKAGIHFIYAPLPEREEKYKPLDRTADKSNSVCSSTARSNYKALGVNLGFIYDF